MGHKNIGQQTFILRRKNLDTLETEVASQPKKVFFSRERRKV